MIAVWEHNEEKWLLSFFFKDPQTAATRFQRFWKIIP